MTADMSNRNYTVADIIRSQTLRGQALPWSFRFVLVPLAWPLTWVFLRLGFGANQSTLIRLAVILVSFVLLLLPDATLRAAGLIAFALALILDCVDGNISRVTDSASFYGKFLDGMVDSLMEVPLPLILALAYWQPGQGIAVIFAGGLASLTFALTQTSMLRYGLVSRDLEVARSSGAKEKRAFEPRLLAFLEHPWVSHLTDFFDNRLLLVVFDLRYVGLTVAAIAGEVEIYLYALAALHLGMYIAFFGARSLRATATLNVRRRSRTAA